MQKPSTRVGPAKVPAIPVLTARPKALWPAVLAGAALPRLRLNARRSRRGFSKLMARRT